MEDIYFQKNRQLPFLMRFMEGITTNMLLGYLYAGGCSISPLSFVYTLHWIVSMYNHLFPSYHSFLLDTYFIDMVHMERLVYMYNTTWIYGIFLFFLITNSNHLHPFLCFGKVMLSILWIIITKNPSMFYNVCFFASALFYILSDVAFRYSKSYLKVLAHVCFHLCLTCAAYEEKKMYFQQELQTFHPIRKIVYLIYIGKTYICYRKK